MKIMNILNFISDIYEHELFPKVLTISIIVLILLFIVVLFLGISDSKRIKKKVKIKEEDVKDITFEDVKEIENIKEDVTFEMPILTKNLEDFKKNLEEEIRKENETEIELPATAKKEEQKAIKILDIEEITNTSLIPIVNENKDEQKVRKIERLEETIELPKIK